MNQELADAQAGFRKSRGTRDRIANICYTTEKAREFKKKKICFIDYKREGGGRGFMFGNACKN